MLVRLVLSHLLPVWLLVSSLLLPVWLVRLLLLFLLPVRLASLPPWPKFWVQWDSERSRRFALRSTVEGRDAQEMVRTRMVCRHQILWG